MIYILSQYLKTWSLHFGELKCQKMEIKNLENRMVKPFLFFPLLISYIVLNHTTSKEVDSPYSYSTLASYLHPPKPPMGDVSNKEKASVGGGALSSCCPAWLLATRHRQRSWLLCPAQGRASRAERDATAGNSVGQTVSRSWGGK